MKHPATMWTEPANSDYPLEVLWDTYAEHLSGRTKPASPATIRKYKYMFGSFMKSLKFHGDPLTLSSVTPVAVERWIADCRLSRIPREDGKPSQKMKEDGIGSNLAALKAFTNKFVYRHLQMTMRDLLERVERYEPQPPMKDGLTSDQIEQVLGCYSGEVYEDIRDRAMIAFFASSGLRFNEVRILTTDMVDPYSGWVKTRGKGDKERIARITERACKYLREYLRHRASSGDCNALWTTIQGRPLSYFGTQTVFKRLKRKSGVAIAHAHRFRHGWTQTALKKGAERALVQDAMGWNSDAMVRRYGGWVRSQTAAAAMPQFAPV
jgi:site-specific recombinase XerD